MDEPLRYKFDTLFTYNAAANTITPKYNVVIGGVRLHAYNSIYPWTNPSGVNIFDYIGKDITGQWDSNTNTLIVLGFYQ